MEEGLSENVAGFCHFLDFVKTYDRLVMIAFPRGTLLGWSTGFLGGKIAISIFDLSALMITIVNICGEHKE